MRKTSNSECVMFQFEQSVYFVQHLPNATWNTANDLCKSNRATLWNINSHDEWFNVYKLLGVSVIDMEANSELKNDQSINILFTVLSYIGLRFNQQVKTPRVK